MTILEKILQLFDNQSEWTIHELVQKTDASKQMVHIAVNKLTEKGILEKLGRTPKTLYRKKGVEKIAAALIEIDNQTAEWLEKEFLLITETGEMKTGIDAFTVWCSQRNLPVKKTLDEYMSTKEKYKPYYNKQDVIDGLDKIKNTKGYTQISLDNLYYLDFYAIERFGKTRLGTLIHFAKQGQNKFLMKILVQEIKQKIHALLNEEKIDAVCFVPPTIRREVQIMKYLQQYLDINLPVITVKKISGIIPVPQKSLNKIEERINNAQSTFAVTENRHFNHIALIDDAVGSGATLNEIAAKMKAKKICSKITGIAVTGSFKGFDVITDV